MRQRGRRSAEALAINVSGAPTRLTAPSGLNAKERAQFEELVNAADPNHFRKAIPRCWSAWRRPRCWRKSWDAIPPKSANGKKQRAYRCRWRPSCG